MQSQNSPETILELRGGESSHYLARLMTKPLLIFLTLIVATAVQMFRRGSSAHYWVLVAGSLVAGILLIAFGLLVVIDRGKKRRGIIQMLLAFGGLVPYAFGSYLFFYEGLWRLKLLMGQFSVSTLVVSLLFIIGGFIIVNGTYLLSEFARKVDEGHIAIKDIGR